MTSDAPTALLPPPEADASPSPALPEAGAPPPEAPPPLSVAEAVVGLGLRLEPGVLHRLGPLSVPGLRPRQVRIYVPRSFDPRRPHPALVLFDGQNLFADDESFAGGWHVDAVVEKLSPRCGPKPVVIGVDHGEAERIRELSPFPLVDPPFRDLAQAGQPGQLALFLFWITGELLPHLAREIPLPWQPGSTFVGGSSMGGLAALYAHFAHPDAFGGALVMSPSFWIADRAIFREVAQYPNPPRSRIYLDAGGLEDRGRLAPVVRAMADRLRERGWTSDRLYWRYDLLGKHNEASWRRRLPRALRFLLRG
jgi:enterochelin esterase-like enzyme